MRLGSSIGRRRPSPRRTRKRRSRRRRRRSSRRAGPVRVFRLALRGVALLLGTFAAGYVVATRVVFPVPAPPLELLVVPGLGGLERLDAQGRIEEAGLVTGAIDSMHHPSAPAGAILGQSPLPGQLAVPGAVVELAVSLGPEQRGVPDMVGLRQERARILLEANGFAVAADSVEGEEPAGVVVAMDPEPGTDVSLPVEVRLAVSLGPPMVEMPALLGRSEEDAAALLDSLGLFVTEIEQQDSPIGVNPPVIVEQEPPAGTMVEIGSVVTLVVGPGTPPPPARPPAAASVAQGSCRAGQVVCADVPAGTIAGSATKRSVVPYRVRFDLPVR